MKEYWLLLALIYTYTTIRSIVYKAIESTGKKTKLDFSEILWIIANVVPTIMFWMFFYTTK